MKLARTVLLVEDDPDDQELFISVLEEIKEVTLLAIAGNGKEAIDLLRRSVVLPTIVFMDINMPVMNGVECLRQIVKDPEIKEIPVVMLSSESYYRDKTRNLGAAGFVKKRPSVTEMRNEIEQIIMKLC